jgi:hypothetical protein
VVILDANSQPKAILDLTKPREHSIDKPALLMAEMAHNHLSAALTDSSNGVFRKRSKSMDKELQNILLLMSASGCDADTDEKDESSEVVDV